MGGRNKRWRKSQRRIVERALGSGDSCSVCGVDEDSVTVFGVCPRCGCELVKYSDGFGCPHGCVFVPFSK